jgi:tRNA splicing ligase
MVLTIKNTFRDGILIYDDNRKLIFHSEQNGYSNFIDADKYKPYQFSSELAKEMCVTAKKIVKASGFNCLSEFLNNIEFPVRINTQTVEVQIYIPNLCL